MNIIQIKYASSQHRVGSTAMTSVDKNFDRLSKAAYESQFLQYGAMPEGVHWVGSERQSLRFKLFLRIILDHSNIKENFEICRLNIINLRVCFQQ